MEAASLSQFAHAGSGPSLGRRAISLSAALFAGAVLRIWMLLKFFEVNGDSQIYGGIARNLLVHGEYALSAGPGEIHNTLIRLPGYPLFLTACFRLFGMENYFPAACIQIFLDMVACLLLASFAGNIFPGKYKTGARHATLWLAALCPFTAIYAAEPLTESLSVFAIALALWSLGRFRRQGRWVDALAFAGAVSYAAMLRPDGALVGIALAPAMVLFAWRQGGAAGKRKMRSGLAKILVCAMLALVPFLAWAWRNWHVFHVFQPLAPRYATDPGEETWPGWQRWMKTWSLDFVSTYNIYWNMPDSPLSPADLPSRAFDSAEQRVQTERLFAAYEANGQELSPGLDQQFAQLAQQRIAAHPLRYYVVLPLGRMADMWLRPRVENLPIDLDWWVYSHHNTETWFSWFYFALNLLYLLFALGGLLLRPCLWTWMLAYLLLRSLLLCTIEAPEARYTIECFPVVFVWGGILVSRLLQGGSGEQSVSQPAVAA